MLLASSNFLSNEVKFHFKETLFYLNKVFSVRLFAQNIHLQQ